ncbi:hypothetical protein ACVWY0_002445 [Arthrobacter sp. UYNi723]
MQLPVTIRPGSSPGHVLRTGEHCTETGWSADDLIVACRSLLVDALLMHR